MNRVFLVQFCTRMEFFLHTTQYMIFNLSNLTISLALILSLHFILDVDGCLLHVYTHTHTLYAIKLLLDLTK